MCHIINNLITSTVRSLRENISNDSGSGSGDAKWALVLLKKQFFVTKKIDFPKIRYKSLQQTVQYSNLVHAHK